MSSTTGSTRLGWMPAAAVYTASLPTEISIPPTPWSPIPRMPSESVATSRSTSSPPSPVLRNASSTSSGWSTDRYTPRVRRNSWLNRSIARPTVGV